MKACYTRDTLVGVIRAMLASSRLSGAELSVRAGRDHGHVDKILTGAGWWPELLSLCRMSEVAEGIRQRLAEINRQLGVTSRQLRREQGWRSPGITRGLANGS
jgi:hypothetical protein